MENFKSQKEKVVYNVSFEKPTGYKNVNASRVKK
jgi:hypothetical protein